MSNEQLKYSIHSLLEEIEDADLLKSIYILLQRTQVSDEVVGYEIDGTPISEDDLVASILEEKASVARGERISFEDMKKELGL